MFEQSARCSKRSRLRPPHVFVSHVVGVGARRAHRAIVGFALHREPRIAAAARDALARRPPRRPVESLLVERLVRMRPWVDARTTAAARRRDQGAAASAERRKRAPNGDRSTGFDLSVCDGAGGAQIIATDPSRTIAFGARAADDPKGVADLAVFDGMQEASAKVWCDLEVDHSGGQTDVGVRDGMLALGLADNLDHGAPPPYRLVQFVELLGLGRVPPDASAPEKSSPIASATRLPN